MRIDITVAAIGDATNLQGGILVLTSLRGADGQVYAVAQGPVVTGGFAAGRGGASQTVNHPTVGRGPNGAIVERPRPRSNPNRWCACNCGESDFTTAARIVEAIKGGSAAPRAAHAENAGLVAWRFRPNSPRAATEFLSDLENLAVEADRPARVVINERTGTIVLGKDVRIAPVAILHGNLSVEIQTTLAVSQPAPLSQGTTQVVPQTTVRRQGGKGRNVVLQAGRHGGRTGARAGRHRLDAARRDRHSAEPQPPAPWMRSWR